MKYSLSSRQSAEYLKKADEIKVEYRDRKIIPDLAEKYPNARINLVLPYDWKSEQEIDWKEIYTYSKLTRDNFILGITSSNHLSQADEHKIDVYHRAPIHTFQELNDVRQSGIDEVILGAPLFFHLDKIKRYFPTMKIRAVANVALPEGSMSYNDGVCGLWIRPEDVALYEEYGVTTIEFFADHSAEQALYRIYAE